MFKGLFRLSMLLVTGKFLKPRIKGLLLLLGFWLLLWFLQSEYLSYVDYSGDSAYVLHASLIKVSLILISLLLYIFAVERRLVKKTSGLSSVLSSKKRPGLTASFTNTKNKNKAGTGGMGNTMAQNSTNDAGRDTDSDADFNEEKNNVLASSSDDGFEFLRHNKKLKSVSDQLLDK